MPIRWLQPKTRWHFNQQKRRRPFFNFHVVLIVQEIRLHLTHGSLGQLQLKMKRNHSAAISTGIANVTQPNPEALVYLNPQTSSLRKCHVHTFSQLAKSRLCAFRH